MGVPFWSVSVPRGIEPFQPWGGQSPGVSDHCQQAALTVTLQVGVEGVGRGSGQSEH